MQAVKEKIQDMKYMRKAKAEAKAEEKVEKEAANAMKEAAHEKRLEKEAAVKREMHETKAHREMEKHGNRNPNPDIITHNATNPPYTAN